MNIEFQDSSSPSGFRSVSQDSPLPVAVMSGGGGGSATAARELVVNGVEYDPLGRL